jgi:hypothetical protein
MPACGIGDMPGASGICSYLGGERQSISYLAGRPESCARRGSDVTRQGSRFAAKARNRSIQIDLHPVGKRRPSSRTGPRSLNCRASRSSGAKVAWMSSRCKRFLARQFLISPDGLVAVHTNPYHAEDQNRSPRFYCVIGNRRYRIFVSTGRSGMTFGSGRLPS